MHAFVAKSYLMTVRHMPSLDATNMGTQLLQQQSTLIIMLCSEAARQACSAELAQSALLHAAVTKAGAIRELNSGVGGVWELVMSSSRRS